MNNHSPILQVVGDQNSGKTTLITKLLKILKESQYRVGTLKRHGHGGDPLYDDTNKDTFKHRSSEAILTGVIAKDQLQITNENNFSLAELLKIYQAFSLDIILVEGFKTESFPKIVLLRTPDDKNLLHEVSNIVLIISWYTPLLDSQIPVFSILDEQGYLTWIEHFLQERIVRKKAKAQLKKVKANLKMPVTQ
jgi:molybdopterin-guanine dinucleotide biosynthesis adapter protein